MVHTSTLDKIKHKVRRSSTSHESLTASIKAVINDADLSHHGRIRAQSFASTLSSRSRSRSVGSGRSRPVSKKDMKALVQHERDVVISKKLQSFLSEYELQSPVLLPTNSSGLTHSSVQFSIANTNDVIYLPAASTLNRYEGDEEDGYNEPGNDLSSQQQNALESDDVQDGYIDSFPESSANHSASAPLSSSPAPSVDFNERYNSYQNEPTSNPVSHSRSNSVSSFDNSINYLSTNVDSQSSIRHTFACIITITKDQFVRNLKFKFQSNTTIFWPSGDPYNKSFAKEKFKIGQLEWSKRFDEADFYLNTANSNDCKYGVVPLEKLHNRTCYYPSYQQMGPQKSSSEYHVKPGIYVFLFPLVFPCHIPATIHSINGSLSHNFSIHLSKVSTKLNRKQTIGTSYELPMVRTPPSVAHSIMAKPIYVNRVWNDSLHYTITFPQKFVPLGTERTVNVKLVPLVKDVVVKRIKFNILERITYVSQNLKREHDFDSSDPYNIKQKQDSKLRERVVAICELKTKMNQCAPGHAPYKEEIIKCPANNLLFSCYENESKSDEVMIASPLDISIALPFLTTKADKTLMRSEYNQDNMPSPRRSSVTSNDQQPVIGTVETHLQHAMNDLNLNERDDNSSPFIEDMTPNQSHYYTDNSSKENIPEGYTVLPKALYPDSNFRHIQINHRLQVCFRISKPDPKDNYKMHHYEVVVDTPIVLLSSKCNDESTQLPEYQEPEIGGNNETLFRTSIFNGETSPRQNMETNGVSINRLGSNEETLPSFEEATSNPSSPIIRSVSFGENELVSGIIPLNDPVPAYSENEEAITIDEVVRSDCELLLERQRQLSASQAENNIEFESGGNIDDPLAKPCNSGLRSTLAASFAPSVFPDGINSEAPVSISSNTSPETDSTTIASEVLLDIDNDSGSTGPTPPPSSNSEEENRPPGPSRINTAQSSIYQSTSFDYSGIRKLAANDAKEFDQSIPLLENISVETDIDRTDDLPTKTNESVSECSILRSGNVM